VPKPLGKTTLTGLAAGVLLAALGVLLIFGIVKPGNAATEPTGVQAIPSQSSIVDGPGGRTALTGWKMRKDAANRGLALNWAKGGFSDNPVSVPNAANALPITGPGGIAGYDGSVGWYRTTLETANAGTYALDFESANFYAQAWVDGRPLGSHIGTYLPFEFRSQLAAGKHTLVVRVDWRNPNGQSALGFHRTWFNFGGLNGEVNVRPIGASELDAPTIQTSLNPDTPTSPEADVALSIEVHNNGPDRMIAPAGMLQHDTQSIPVSFAGQLVKHGQTIPMQARVTVPAPALWSPSAPNLYDLTIAVGQESSYFAKVGLRQLTWKAGQMYLNGAHLVLHGASIEEDVLGHGDALTPGDQDAIVRQLKQINANATRSQHPLDPGLLQRLDAAGILIWQGVGPVDGAGNWSSTTPALLRNAELRVRTTVRDAQTHPSIIAWNLANEVAGNGHRGGQAQYVIASTNWLHSYDRGRLVSVDIWGTHPPRQPGPLYSNLDAVAETDYSGWYDNPHANAQQVSALIHARTSILHRSFPHKVQIISEFGAESNSLNASNAPGGFAFQSLLLKRHIRAYDADPQLSGILIWNLRDFALTPTFAGGSVKQILPHIKLRIGLNQKGLFTYWQSAKPAVGVVARLFKALPAD
jgi:Glycosyl hydrolases family 2, TIM barrel domain/Glycosyl hydrolases family 2